MFTLCECFFISAFMCFIYLQKFSFFMHNTMANVTNQWKWTGLMMTTVTCITHLPSKFCRPPQREIFSLCRIIDTFCHPFQQSAGTSTGGRHLCWRSETATQKRLSSFCRMGICVWQLSWSAGFGLFCESETKQASFSCPSNKIVAFWFRIHSAK